MTTLLKLLPIIVAALLMVSCSTSQLYYQPLTKRPAIPWKGSSGGWGGYYETSPRSGTYDITFESYNKPDSEATAYLGMLRAAERAAIDGKSSFYLVKPISNSTNGQTSYFPAYQEDGRYVTKKVKRTYINPKTGKKETEHISKRIWKEGEYHEAANIVNYIHKSSLRISYSGKSSARQDTKAILRAALADTRGYGKPKLDSRALNFIASP